MTNRKLYTIDAVAEFHRICGLSQPQHPLISLVDYSQVEYQIDEPEISWVQELYFMGFKRNLQGKLHYGQSQYDFDGGLMCFIAPRQLVRMIIDKYDTKPSGFLLAFHPDFIWNTPLAKTIHNYKFFGYDVNEALFLSEKEEETLIGLFKGIEREYQSGIDEFTQSIIISQIEVILNYCERFYQRQFITRKKSSHQVLDKLENILEDYFNNKVIDKGLPTANYIAESLNISTNYLGSLLKSLTGQTTQQHIHEKLIEKAKEKLSTTELSVSEIAYELGFEHSQSFSKLFKAKTEISPLEFRKSFN
ncbi:helix-turn-helix domain-containing protein [Chryseobacterium taihuense]|uniref:AraC-type DNA-binding protein n=1 Tax=Chryseobacterium taihuense TaxID=1141221 RepID=A0ABY0QZ11_9FLAO|nr:response regulator transcription factor [Chryseobacterium taihuense]SDM14146.1 AraC-type DNA-binding protein [Chryseobacterium taihuense]